MADHFSRGRVMKTEKLLRPATCTRILATLCVLLVLHLPVLADERTDRIETLEKRLEKSLKLIERLEARVAELERDRNARTSRPGAEQAAAAPAPASAPKGVDNAELQSHAQAITALQQEVDQLSEGLSKSSADTGLPLHGFADVGAGWSSGSDPQRLRGFNAGTLDLYLVPQFGERVRSLFEVAFEYDPSGRLSADVERLQLGYTLRDDLTVWMGRFHTPFGLWNTWFHHGANLQASITRPRFIEFEDKGGIIPAHSVGVWASGKLGVSGGKITYDTYVSNGPSIRKRMLDYNPFTDDDGNKMFGLNIGYQPAGDLRGLSVGLHGFASSATAFSNSETPRSRTRLRMAGAYFGYDANDWEAIGEYYRFSNSDVETGRAYSSTAWFTQVGKTFGSWTPYGRYERASLNPQDVYFSSQELGRSYRRASVGVRYALDSRSSFKLELGATREDPLGQLDDNGLGVLFPRASYRRAAFQYSIAF
jgi:hypothetical protein